MHGDLDLLNLTLTLQPWLTNSDHEKRGLGCRLLSGVVVGAPEALVGGKADVMADFLGARLSDWPCAEHAAIACLSLVNGKSGNDGLITAEAGVVLLRKFATAVQVPPMARPERQQLLALWLALLQKYGSATLLSSSPGTQVPSFPSVQQLDLVDITLAAIEGEKDPRCLLLAFQILDQVSRLYHTPKVDPLPLQSRAEEVIDTLGCYWPIKFTPPKNDPHGITRQMLEDGIEAAMASSPFLAPFALPLILEKLASTLRSAKHDALSALALCCSSYGRDVLTRQPQDRVNGDHMASHSPYSCSSPHDSNATLLSRIWAGLRAELLSPCDPEIFSTTGALGAVSEELSLRLETAVHASTCLSSCLDSLGGVLVDLIVEDGSVGGWMKSSLQESSDRNEHGDSPAASARFSCVSSILAALSSSSPEGLSAILANLFPLVLHSISSPPVGPSDESLQSSIRGLQFICLVAKSLCKCDGMKLEAMRSGLEGLIRSSSQCLDALGVRLDQLASAALEEATLIYCYTWTNLLALANRLFPTFEPNEGQRPVPRDLVPPSVAHSLTTRLTKWSLAPSEAPLSAHLDPALASAFGSLVPTFNPKSKGLICPSNLVRSPAAAIASPASLLPLQQASLDALSSLLSSRLAMGGGCLTLTDRVLDEIMSTLVSFPPDPDLFQPFQPFQPFPPDPDLNDKAALAHRWRSQSLKVASTLSSDPRLPDLGWALMGRWRDPVLGPLALNAAHDGQDTHMITAADESSLAASQLELSRDLVQCMASSILPGLLSSLPSSTDAASDEWKLKSAASFAASLLNSLSVLDHSTARFQDILLVCAPFIGWCVAIAGRWLNPSDFLGPLAATSVQHIAHPNLSLSEASLSPLLCAVITFLPPSLLSLTLIDQSLKASLLSQLVKLAVEQRSSTSASVALASLIVKAPDSEIRSLASLVIPDSFQIESSAWLPLSWLCRSLVMRKHEMSSVLIDRAISTINAPGDRNQLVAIKEAAALMFRLLVADSSPPVDQDDSGRNEGEEERMAMQALSPYGRPLWRQRAFDSCLRCLDKALSDSSSDHFHLSLALCHLIGACAESQPRLLTGSASVAGPSLALSLQFLSSPASAQEAASAPPSLPAALTGSLDALGILLGISHGPSTTATRILPWPEAGSHLTHVLPALSSLTAFKGSARVRNRALELLTGIMLAADEQGQGSALSYHALHPHRLMIIKAVKMAVDDPRRAVRKAAIQCIRVWNVKV